MKFFKGKSLGLSLALIVTLAVLGLLWGQVSFYIVLTLASCLSIAVCARRYLNGKVRSSMVIFGAGSAALMVLAEYFCMVPIPIDSMQNLVFVLRGVVLPGIIISSVGVSLIYFFVSILQTLLVKNKRLYYFKSVLLAAALVMGLACTGIIFTETVRMQAFSDFSERFQPLVQAISAYQKDNGSPPEKLSDLQPKYIAVVPEGTGMGRYYPYQYKVNPEGNKTPEPWELKLSCPTGLFTWDSFFYWPSERYPNEIDGDTVQPVRNWAYVHHEFGPT